MNHRFVIADDQLIIRRLLSDIVTEMGGVVEGEGASGKEVLELVSTHKPDVVLLDITMPQVGGLDVLRAIKRLAPQTKVIMVTAVRGEQEIQQAIQLGADDYVSKPFQKETIQAAIERTVGPCKVLVADDQLFFRRILDQCIEKSGWAKVAEATNGKEAIELFTQYRPDLLLLDVDMPLRNGIEALRVILQVDPGARVIMMGAPTEKARIQGLGAKGFLEKPVDIAHLEALIRRIRIEEILKRNLSHS